MNNLEKVLSEDELNKLAALQELTEDLRADMTPTAGGHIRWTTWQLQNYWNIIKRLCDEVARLEEWEQLIFNAPGKSQEVIRQRMIQGDAIKPIIQSWKDGSKKKDERIKKLETENMGLLCKVSELSRELGKLEAENERLEGE